MNIERIQQLAGLISEKSTSEKQARFMAAVSHDPKFAKKVGIDQSVAKEFNKADTGTKQLSNAMKHKNTNEGSEADMQTMGTIGRNRDYAEFDNSQEVATEDTMSYADMPSSDSYYSVFSQGDGNRWQHYFDADSMLDAKDEAESLRNAGLKVKIFKVPKSEANWTKIDPNAYVLDRLAKAKKFYESIPAIDSCNQDNPANADIACAMESNMIDSNYEKYNDLFRNLMYAYVEPDEAFKFIGQEMTNDGIQGTEYDEILSNLQGDFFPDSQIAHDDFDDAQFSDLAEGYGNNAKVHDLRGMDHGDVYSRTQTDNNISDGDVIIADNAIAVMCKSWPVLVSGNSNEFHTLEPGISFTDYENGRYEESEMLAQHLAQENGIVEEDFNLQNGYDDINCANGDDYFPSGADSPVIRTIGPSGARQGDNPEQKKMQVAETHKELVYAYRSFLKESKKK